MKKTWKRWASLLLAAALTLSLLPCAALAADGDAAAGAVTAPREVMAEAEDVQVFYDGQAHSISVRVTNPLQNAVVTYSSDGLNFHSSNPTLSAVGAHTCGTRGDLALILFRLSKAGKGFELTFSDVPADKYYADGIAWAAKTGVVAGRSEELFDPETAITREELALMLYRYAKLLNLEAKAPVNTLNAFSDRGSVHSWAKEGVAWCVERGILQGKGGGRLDPRAGVTRAEVAVMFQRLLELLK